MQVIGNIGRQPEVKTGRSGSSYTVFSLAENHMGKDYTGPEIPTTWYDVTCWPKPEDATKLVKGAFVRLTGRLEPRIWWKENPEFPGDDSKKTPQISLGFKVHKIEFMERGQGSGEGQGGNGAAGGGNASGDRQAPAQRPAAAARPQGQAQQQHAPTPPVNPRGGFDDMDDDIPF